MRVLGSIKHHLSVEVLAATLARMVEYGHVAKRRRQRQMGNIERQQAALREGLASVEAAQARAADDAAHIEFLSHQYAFVTFLPSIAGVFLAIAVITLSGLARFQLLLVLAALILSVLSPLFMLLLERQYRRQAPDRWEAVQRRAVDRHLNSARSSD